MTETAATSHARIEAAQAAAQAADDAWHASLLRAFGRQACNRRYDEDTLRHPEECRRLQARFHAASIALRLAWQASGEVPITEAGAENPDS